MSARPWLNVTDAVLVDMTEDDASAIDDAWTAFHERQGCEQDVDDGSWSHNAAKCRPADRQPPGIADRWDRLGKACDERGCEWPADADGWTHVPGCRFRRRIESKDDTRKEIGLNVHRAEENAIPEKPLRVLRAIAAAGLADETPSIDVMAGRPWLCEQTGLEDGEVKAAVAYLIRNRHLEQIEPERIALGFLRRYAIRGRHNGRPANWYRILPPPAPIEPRTPAYDRLDAVLAEVAS